MSFSESMTGMKRTHMCTALTEEHIDENVTIMGWVQKRRDLGGVIFLDVRDRTGLLQVVVDISSIGDEGFKKSEKIRTEFVIAVKGLVEKRTEETINTNLQTGTIEVRAMELRILSDAETPPFQIEENSSVREDLRLKYRYLDLRRPDLQKKLMLRSKLTEVVRSFMSEEGFVDLETPMLTKSTPEGARDYLVPSRVNPGNFYALPQSPQIFKQLLMLSGFDKYYQIVKCFRDEDLRADRQPEFTQIDIEMSFVDEDDVMNMNERLLAKMFKEVMDVDIALPIKRLTYQEAMDRFGSDKPDLRFGMELVNISDIVKDSDFKVFSGAVANGGSVRGINAKTCGDMPRRQIDALGEAAVSYGAKGMAWIAINEDGTYKSAITKFLSEEIVEAMVAALEGQPGDLLLFCADKNEVVYNTLGNLRLDIAKRLDLLKKDVFDFVWVTDFPLVEWNPEQKRYTAMHHMFTMPKEEDMELMTTDISKVRSRAYDICLNGNEIGGGSLRIHQREVQERVFEALGFSEEDAYDRFGFLLDAFRYGVPPHGGLAYGLDRIAMLMTGSDSIRDVIAFPKVKDASCPMTSAPGVVEEKQLEELAIRIDKIEL
ncbi:aspartyl-tRNA synthetase, promiscuous (also recognizes tRNAasn) [Petrocella atlantisensis]|uniref:Aspartate--tRNA ligase n=1 Tax=Petrocella atlantisensis TaxID=2173034 RepID=A0A3P7S272_9FIRM|nr:aspartate--tRNA ligase [Petrocella atlantisensis]MCF8018676.1 aspartate--tRNA ligase [Vallitaleaceae bacterium]VDN48936.1 aspartyl-tRNA synthetase, promiscuous (also recognizes tRNAasn) [Petrocella atlantisensis]